MNFHKWLFLYLIIYNQFHPQQKPEGNTYHSGYTWKADPDANSFAEVRPIVAASNADADLWVMMAKDQYSGYIGLAYVGVLCASKQYSCSINEKLYNVVASAEVCIILVYLVWIHLYF